ncbi:phosphatase PAP2 family protein [Pontibacter ruber]|uniref:Phosphatase PAP2 family protein n=1 Tax=Pontibacter ruber TaxID=1343895 RepID=A0ABW5D1I7_9BACT|nr:phosphatase PAP2 family protein [Pontibacter ruber]
MKNLLLDTVQRLYWWLEQHPLVQRQYQRTPRLVRHTLNRLNPRLFTGLPLTLLVLIFWFNASLLSELTEDVIESEGMMTFDDGFSLFLYSMRTDQLSQVFYFFTLFGGREATYIVGGILTAIMLYRRRYVGILVFWLVMAGVGLSVQYGKKYISRDRPSEIAFYAEHNHSFPSGHATTAISLYGMVAYFLCRHYTSYSKRVVILGTSAMLILIIGFSRIYLGVHYLTDVLAGFLLGAMWVLLGISLMELITFRARKMAANKV